jgi:hypothetical protein
MTNVHSEGAVDHAVGGGDDDDDRDDEHALENEAPIREVDDQTEAPEEFERDDEDEPDDLEDQDVDDEGVDDEADEDQPTA